MFKVVGFHKTQQTQRPSPMGSEVSGETDSEQWITESLSNEALKEGSRLFRMTVTWEGLLIWGLIQSCSEAFRKRFWVEYTGLFY